MAEILSGHMMTMISFKQFILESRSAPLYHGTTAKSAESIVRVNRFNTSDDWEDAAGSGVALSRNIGVARKFAVRFLSNIDDGVVFELDQQKLS